jgi:hypothetical protein
LKETKIMTKAKTLASHFQTKTRRNGKAESTAFVTLKDSAPKWLQEAVREAHNGALPCDWVYAECEAACQAIDEDEKYLTNETHEYADSRVDIYTHDVYQWLVNIGQTSIFSEAEEEARGAEAFGHDATIEKRIQVIQYYAILRIAATILEAVDQHTTEERLEASVKRGKKKTG